MVFFKTVSSEISQQISALENEANSTLLHLQQVNKKVLDLKKQMENDYSKITGRYVKNFDDLNGELENRIRQIDKQIFEFEKVARKNLERFLNTGLASTVSVFGKENASFSAKISVAFAKNKAFEAINKAKNFLFLRQRTANIIQEATIGEAHNRTFYAPSCFAETQDKSFDVFLPLENKILNDSKIAENTAHKFKSENLNWQSITEKESEKISNYLNACINEKYNSPDPKIKRIREMVQKLINLQGVQICKS